MLLIYFQDVPPDISVCVFVLEQALSVRALQEMVTSEAPDSTVSIQCSSKHRGSYMSAHTVKPTSKTATQKKTKRS